jgi:hypothetical protein
MRDLLAGRIAIITMQMCHTVLRFRIQIFRSDEWPTR